MSAVQANKLRLKWVNLQKTNFPLKKLVVSQWGLIAFESAESYIGLTLFETRDLNPELARKLIARANKYPPGSISKISVVMPQFMSKQWESYDLSGAPCPIEVQYSPFIKIQSSEQGIFIDTKIRVASLDDSPVIHKYLKNEFDHLGYIDCLAQLTNPLGASKELLNLNPDVITLDIQMPQKNGVQVLKEILQERDIPVIMISSVEMTEGSQVFEALQAGAFEYIQKPDMNSRLLFRETLNEKLLAAATQQDFKKKIFVPKPVNSAYAKMRAKVSYDPNLLWAIGSSTGGTQALTHVLTSLPTEVPPIVIVQHIPPVFSAAFAKSMNELCPFEVKEAEDGDLVTPNRVLIAPGGTQMKVIKDGAKLVAKVTDDAPVNRFKPSVDYLFHSIADIRGPKVVAGILTGMGKDGAEGLLALRNNSARTLSQDEASCVVYGMPRAAMELNASEQEVPLHEIAEVFIKLSESFNLRRSA